MKLELRHIREPDAEPFREALRRWWGGRDLSHLAIPPFFRHFRGTSFVLEDGRGISGFLIGFVSQSEPEEGYIHLAGVQPGRRQRGLARWLYEAFFEEVRGRGCTIVSCVTSPTNGASISFHRHMGFEPEGEGNSDSLPVIRDYAGAGEDRVLLRRALL